jgi:ABC-type branched-subunit amino acid transport system substrate-binding protein
MRTPPAALLLLAAGFLSGCGGADRGLRLVTLTDLTGPHAAIGQGIRMAVELALADRRAELLDAGWRIGLASFDAFESSPDLPDAVSRIAAQADVFCAVAHTSTDGNIAAAQILNAAGIPVLLPAETAPLPSGSGLAETAWLSADDPTRGGAIANWAAKSFADILLLMDSGRHAQAVGGGFLKRAGELGVSVSISPFPADDDPSGWALSIHRASPKLIVFSGSSSTAGTLLGSLENLEYSGAFFFAESEADDSLPEVFSSDRIRIYFSPAAEQSEAFLRPGHFAVAFRGAYDADAPDLSGLGYDAAAICLQSLLLAGNTGADPTTLRMEIAAEWRTDFMLHGLTGEYSPARRPCRTSIYVRSDDSPTGWQSVSPLADSGCGRVAGGG